MWVNEFYRLQHDPRKFALLMSAMWMALAQAESCIGSIVGSTSSMVTAYQLASGLDSFGIPVPCNITLLS